KEYTGEILAPPEYPTEHAQRGGHIPGAVNIPWSQAVNADGVFKPYDEIKRLYEAQGVTADKDVIAYCRIGERSSFTWFVLKYLLGYPEVRNYDGAWTEWGNLVRNPTEEANVNVPARLPTHRWFDGPQAERAVEWRRERREGHGIDVERRPQGHALQLRHAVRRCAREVTNRRERGRERVPDLPPAESGHHDDREARVGSRAAVGRPPRARTGVRALADGPVSCPSKRTRLDRPGGSHDVLLVDRRGHELVPVPPRDRLLVVRVRPDRVEVAVRVGGPFVVVHELGAAAIGSVFDRW